MASEPEPPSGPISGRDDNDTPDDRDVSPRGSRDDASEATQRVLVKLKNSLEASEESDFGAGVTQLGAGASKSTKSEVEHIAQRIRRWREESDLTLHELARRSGVAASTIQKIETGQMVPTIAVLLKVARGLDRSPSDLVRDSAEELGVAHLRAEERHRVSVAGRLVLERLVGDVFEPTLEVWRITYEPGSGSGMGRFRFDGECLILCESGQLTVSVGDEEFIVDAGDALHYKATLPHAWRNDGSVPCRFVVIGTLPRAMRAALHQQLRRGDAA